MGCEQDTVETLRSRGQKVTPQRLIITSVLRHEPGHLTAAEILREVKGHFPYVDISTVYRTLATLRDLQLVAETDVGGDRSYEWLREPHYHLLCRLCGREASLPREHVRALADRLREDTGFQIDVDHLALTGVCDVCSARSRRAGAGPRASRKGGGRAHS